MTTFDVSSIGFYVLDILAARYLRRGELVRLLPGWATDTRRFFAAYPKTSFTPSKVREFVAFLPAALAEAAAGTAERAVDSPRG